MNWLKFFIFMCRGCIALFLLLLYSQFIFGQGFKVEEFKILPFDVTASIQMRSDSLNTPCGLVKVLTDDLYVKFVGNVVGSVQNKTNEYWVYLSKGTKELTIMRNQYLPLIVKFGDYEINEVESKVVYQLRLKDVSYNSTKNSLIINLKPKTSLLEIDNIEIERNQDGYYMFLLEKGEHVCRISNKNYLSKIEVVNIGKGTTLLDVKLESLMAEVKIECKTTDAHLFLNNKEIGIGTWEGELPAGSYTIVAKKVGHNPQTLEISIVEKEKRTISIAELKRERFPIYIKTSPSVCFMRKVKVDGKTIGSDSICTTHISAGDHTIEVDMTGCRKINEKRHIESLDTLVYILSPQTDIYKKAYQNNISSLVEIVNKTYGEEAFYWGDLACNQLYKLNNNEIKRIWEEKRRDWSFLIGLYNSSKERRQKAYELLDKFASCNIDVFFIATSYYDMGDYEKALPWYLKSLKDISYESVPGLSDRYFKIAICYKEIDIYSKAIEYCTKAEKIYSGEVPPKEFLGECYLHMGNKNMAIRWFKAALRCYIDGNFLGRNQFLEKMKSIGLYDNVVDGIL